MLRLPRFQLPELEDLPYFPRVLRGMMTDCLSGFHRLMPAYDAVVPALVRALRECKTTRIFDFASGSGETTTRVAMKAAEEVGIIQLTLSDLYPHVERAGEPEGRSNQLEVRYLEEPVDLRVSRKTGGFRTLFTAFHHLPPQGARAVLEDAVRNGEGIGVFEVTERSLYSLLLVFSTPLLTLLVTPLLPFEWRRLVLTYLIPVIPLAVFWDGVASIFRSYTTEELRQFGRQFPEYKWHIERCSSRFFIPVTLLIGTPRTQ